MHVATRWRAVRGISHADAALKGVARKGLGAVIVCGMVVCTPAIARAATPPPSPADGIDLHLVADLELRAQSASPREQSFLYADLANKMTLLASRQLADGEIEKAEATLQKLESCTEKMESNFAQSKSLKKTELLLHLTNRRLTDMARAASYDMKPHVQEALQRLNAAQTSLLSVIFAK